MTFNTYKNYIDIVYIGRWQSYEGETTLITAESDWGRQKKLNTQIHAI